MESLGSGARSVYQHARTEGDLAKLPLGIQVVYDPVLFGASKSKFVLFGAFPADIWGPDKSENITYHVLTKSYKSGIVQFSA